MHCTGNLLRLFVKERLCTGWEEQMYATEPMLLASRISCHLTDTKLNLNNSSVSL